VDNAVLGSPIKEVSLPELQRLERKGQWQVNYYNGIWSCQEKFGFPGVDWGGGR